MEMESAHSQRPEVRAHTHNGWQWSELIAVFVVLICFISSTHQFLFRLFKTITQSAMVGGEERNKVRRGGATLRKLFSRFLNCLDFKFWRKCFSVQRIRLGSACPPWDDHLLPFSFNRRLLSTNLLHLSDGEIILNLDADAAATTSSSSSKSWFLTEIFSSASRQIGLIFLVASGRILSPFSLSLSLSLSSYLVFEHQKVWIVSALTEKPTFSQKNLLLLL